ncbi:MAG: hypothetical protein ACJAVK_001758 [Akkermansiaceae bacterium]
MGFINDFNRVKIPADGVVDGAIKNSFHGILAAFRFGRSKKNRDFLL